ncbi:MAG: hypothetical protein ACP5QA_11685 [Phycisphaerae bacterium]
MFKLFGAPVGSDGHPTYAATAPHCPPPGVVPTPILAEPLGEGIGQMLLDAPTVKLPLPLVPKVIVVLPPPEAGPTPLTTSQQAVHER